MFPRPDATRDGEQERSSETSREKLNVRDASLHGKGLAPRRAIDRARLLIHLRGAPRHRRPHLRPHHPPAVSVTVSASAALRRRRRRLGRARLRRPAGPHRSGPRRRLGRRGRPLRWRVRVPLLHAVRRAAPGAVVPVASLAVEQPAAQPDERFREPPAVEDFGSFHAKRRRGGVERRQKRS